MEKPLVSTPRTRPDSDAPSNPTVCSANMEDALAKLQDIITAAVDAVTVKEADPETVARVKKKWVVKGASGCTCMGMHMHTLWVVRGQGRGGGVGAGVGVMKRGRMQELL
jgi:hypothetical protein